MERIGLILLSFFLLITQGVLSFLPLRLTTAVFAFGDLSQCTELSSYTSQCT